MAIRLVIHHIGLLLCAAILVMSVAMLPGCRSKPDTVTLSSSAVVLPPVPVSGSPEASDAGARTRVPDPIVGFRYDRPPSGNNYPRVSADGKILAIWTHVDEVEEEDGPTALYLLGKRVDTDEEIKRLLLEYPLGTRDQYCRQPGSARLLDCPPDEIEERKNRASEFLNTREWRELPTFGMVKEKEGCSEEGTRQDLVFPNVRITFSNLVLRVEKANGQLLMERKLTPWKPYGSFPRVAPTGFFYVMFIGLDLERRVLLAALTYCHHGEMADRNFRYYAIRLPSLE